MVAEWMQQLLIFQDREQRREALQQKLEDAPREIEANKLRIQGLLESVEIALKQVTSLSVQRKAIEGQIEDAEGTIRKYRNQQLQVKKNEEYTALEHEIAALNAKISGLEDVVLGLMDGIDAANAHAAETQAKVDDEIAVLERHNQSLEEGHQTSVNNLQSAKEAAEGSAAKLDPAVLQQYRYVRSQVKRTPVVVALEDGRCQGCRLRVSGDTESGVRRGHEVVRCENCGRILYFE